MDERPEQSRAESADWLKPRIEEPALQRYLATLRERVWLIVIAVVVTLAATGVYLATASKTYRGRADVLITPVAQQDTLLASLGLIQQSSDPTRDVETAARLITAWDVAKGVKRQLRTRRSPDSLLADVHAVPVAQSNIVEITAEAPTPSLAKNLANAFGVGAIAERRRAFHRQLEREIVVRRQTAGKTAFGLSGSQQVAADLARLETLRSSPDPTMRLETRAHTPSSPAWPKPKLSIAAGLVAGLILGIGAAFASQVLDLRLRREEQIRRLFRVPILARIPRESGRHGYPLGPDALSPAALEAYRTLRGTLSAARGRRDGPHSILVTGASPSEGKTTTAVNLASSLAVAGNRVILIEADLRRPSIGEVFRVSSERGTVSVLIGEVTLEEALVETATYGSNLRLLLADTVDDGAPELLSLPAGRRLVEEARKAADFVVIDSPPLTEVIDALPLAQTVDGVVIVVRLGKSHLNRIVRLGEVLADNGVRPAGFAVVGTARPRRGEGYYNVGRAEPAPAGGEGSEAPAEQEAVSS